MRCPALAELPPPPPGRTGWPWTRGSTPLSCELHDIVWPRISIVTPSYNHGDFLEETIRSILLQGYPDLEYVIMDGGSTDRSPEIIEKYRPWLKFSVSEKDSGTVDAINRGFCHLSGSLCNWISSDDSLRPNALLAIASIMQKVPDVDLIAGARILRAWQTGVERLQVSWMSDGPLHRAGFPAAILQEATFFSRQLWERSGPLDGRFKFMFDVAFFAKAMNEARAVCFTDLSVSIMTLHSKEQKTRADDPQKDVEHRILESEYFPRGLRGLAYRLSRTRFSGLAQHALFPFVKRENRHFVALYDYDHLDWVIRPTA